jgi:hypothetical protein
MVLLFLSFPVQSRNIPNLLDDKEVFFAGVRRSGFRTARGG